MKTQAWAWLVAGVVALGLNGFYQDGGFDWAHQVADRIESRSGAVLALATGRADQFYVEAKMVMPPEGPTPCDWSRAMARAQMRMARAQVKVDNWQAVSDRQEAQRARVEATRDRIEAQVAAETARIRIPAVTLNPVAFKAMQIEACPRVHVNMPRITRVSMPAINIPRIEIPRIEIPRVEIPRINIPAVPAIRFESEDSGPI
jgi:hypothetical protein